jgi:thiol-disulfide isomerase/thioredoxin
MWSTYVLSQREPSANQGQLQDKWLKDLETFVGQHPQATDSAEALLQLGMYQEFLGKADQAPKWYQQLVTTFPKASQSAKASGALRRLASVGKPIRLSGPDLQGGTVDLNSSAYRGKVVLVHYWATWVERCKEDMVLLRDFYTKRKGELEIVAVCFDDDAATAKQYLAQNRFPWKHIHERGGLDNRLANEMGVMTMPLMLLVDQKGNVANNNIQIAELQSELDRLTKPADAAANALRSAAPPR